MDSTDKDGKAAVAMTHAKTLRQMAQERTYQLAVMREDGDCPDDIIDYYAKEQAACEAGARTLEEKIGNTKPSPDTETPEQKIRAIVQDMRAAQPYKSHDLGYADSISSNRVEDWADEIEAALATVASQAHTLAQLTAERDAFRRDWQAELDGNAALRQEFGARDDETFYAFIKRLAEAQAHTRPEPGWQPIETAPKDDTVILRPHRIWGAMDVRYKPSKLGDESVTYPWLNGDYTTGWPETAFLPFWMPLPPPPGSTPTVASSSPEIVTRLRAFETQLAAYQDTYETECALIGEAAALLVQRTEERDNLQLSLDLKNVDCERALDAEKHYRQLSQQRTEELRLARGAITAQDERERQAGERCGVSRDVAGCDWPEAMAEEIGRLTRELAEEGQWLHEAEGEIARLREEARVLAAQVLDRVEDLEKVEADNARLRTALQALEAHADYTLNPGQRTRLPMFSPSVAKRVKEICTKALAETQGKQKEDQS